MLYNNTFIVNIKLIVTVQTYHCKVFSRIILSITNSGIFLLEHRIRFVYTPKHASWMNQIEIWFSILVQCLIKRGNFTSIENLKSKICRFIEYYNVTAIAFKWTYMGKLLTK